MNILIHTLIVGTCTLYIPMNMIRVWNQGWLNSWGSAVLFLDFSGYPFTLKTNIRFHWEKTVSNRFIINGGIWLIKCIYSHFQSYCINLFTNRKTFLFSDQLTWSINDKEFFHWNYFVVYAWWQYFCHHLSDNYVDLSDFYVVLSDLNVDLSDLYFDLSLIHLLEN